ncbi:MAG: sugar ABC transporter ATP-binding protein [Oscillospiraceae bacterium]|nr:sugar ABC transporter ATP-binding protein [Oscillospiraceae bacterium]MBQ9930426.1 sugar ABC transporter ATP-binding protein [Oscillospiraceae bacterium]
MGETILKMHGIQKYFPGVHALDNAQLEVRSGEVMALVGENGAGKSTLMKILTGIYPKDGGIIEYFGEEIELNGPKDAQSRGICIVHQELNLMQHLTVADNIFIGRESSTGLFLNQAEQYRKTQELLDKLHLSIDPKAVVRTLSVAKQQMVEIAKALSYNNTKLLILDEPSAVLTDTEIDDLFTFVEQLKSTGVGIIYISHRMDELQRITDRITVMRDGQYVGVLETAETEIAEVVRMMVGRTIYEEPKTQSAVPADAPIILECEHLNSIDVKDVSFHLKKGEILGFSGLMGAGRTETMRLLCGADPMTSGVIKLNGKPVRIKTPRDAVKHGIGYLSEDRKRYGLCLNLSITDNTVMPSLGTLFKGLFINDRAADRYSEEYIEKIKTKTPSTKTRVGSLSGGNQQKVVISKWLLRDCDILIFDEPTRGIDVGAKSEIYKLMNQLAAEGKSIIMISSDMPELLRMSDRIVVMCEGRKTGELDISEATQEKIMTFATNR